jgi:hypothetical protein
MAREIWKDIPGYEGYYKISNLGRVRSVDRYVNTRGGTVREVKGKDTIIYYNKSGYYYAPLWKDNKIKNISIKLTTYKTFKGDIPSYHKVLNKDGNIKNNAIDNLYLVKHVKRRSRELTQIKKIIKIVGSNLCVDIVSILSKSKKREIVIARQLCHFFAKELRVCDKNIHKEIGNVDRNTPNYSVKCVNNLLDTDPIFRATFRIIKEKIDMAFYVDDYCI